MVVSPRGFGPSSRRGPYDGAGCVADIGAVLDHLRIEACAGFGYSMNGAMAALLALDDPRVAAVAIGGFPLTADLSGMGVRARARNEATRSDPEQWDALTAVYDPAAAEAVWDHVAGMPRGAFAALPCPVRAWWGGRDTVLASIQEPAELARDLDALQIPFDVLPGLNHGGALERLGLVLPTIAEWLHTSMTTSG